MSLLSTYRQYLVIGKDIKFKMIQRIVNHSVSLVLSGGLVQQLVDLDVERIEIVFRNSSVNG